MESFMPSYTTNQVSCHFRPSSLPDFANFEAWNDYSLAPFASDVSSVLRSTWFSGRAWMVTLRRIREVRGR
jgi:hypothetical protein